MINGQWHEAYIKVDQNKKNPRHEIKQEKDWRECNVMTIIQGTIYSLPVPCATQTPSSGVDIISNHGLVVLIPGMARVILVPKNCAYSHSHKFWLKEQY